MVEIAKKHQDQLKRIKENVEKSYQYFKNNYQRWHESKKFLYITSLTDDDVALLEDLKKPQLEFNILEAYVSRQKGEFSKQEPSIKVEAGSEDEVDPKVIDVVEGYLRHTEKMARNDNTAYEVYDDMLSGGFSVVKVWTEYAHEMSFDQQIKIGRVFDPTLCGFDPLARAPHKGDGEYCFEIFPRRKKEFKEEFPNIDISQLNFQNSTDGFTWSYKTQTEEILLLVDYYEKKRKKVKIVKLTNGKTMTIEEYEKFLVNWEMEGHIEQAPQVVGEPRSTTMTYIVRYRFIEDQLITPAKDTDFSYLPLVFCDGDSVMARPTENGPLEQYTRPYCYQARGVQRLKNFAGQTLANEIENMVQHKFKVPLEGIPEQYLAAYTDYQVPNTLIYHQFYDNNPDVRLDPPQEINRVPTPPEVIQAFTGADQTTQAILGTYDAALGIQKHQLSGIAIIEGATQSNAAAMPYIVGYLNGLTQIAQIVLDLIPKYYVTPRTIPVVAPDGKRKFVKINGTGQPQMDYTTSALNVDVSAGVNFSIQRSRALQQIVALMQASESFAAFVNNTPQGLNALLDNIEMRGIDQLKEAVDGFLKQRAQQQQQQQQMAMQNNPAMQRVQIDKQKMMLNHQDTQQKNQIDLAGVAVQDKQADTGRLKVLADVQNTAQTQELERDKLTEEHARTAVDLVMKGAEMHRKINP